MIRVQFNPAEFRRYIRDLGKLANRAVPFAMRNALNTGAFELQREWRSETKKSFTLRNPYTVRSIRVTKASGSKLESMRAVVYSDAEYMNKQEYGGIRRGKGGAKAIPAPASAGNAPGSAKRTRTTRAAFALGAINLNQPNLAGYGRRRRNAITLAIAIRRGDRFALLSRSKGKGVGIFELRGKSTRRANIRMLWDFSRASTKTKPNPTLHRSVDTCGPRFQKALKASLLQQLKRHKVFGY